MRSSTSRRGLRLLLISLVLLVVGFVLLIRFAYTAASPGKPVTIDRLYALADRGQIASATLLDEEAQVVGAVASDPCPARKAAASSFASSSSAAGGAQPAPDLSSTRCSGSVEDFHASYPRSDAATQQLIARLAAGGATLSVDKQADKAVAKLVITFVFPLLMLANLFGLIFLSRGGDSSLADIAGFGKVARRRRRERYTGTGVSFADVAGAEEAVAELREVTDYLQEPKRFQAYGAVAPKGVLLFGPPGCGKTLLARAVAGESRVPFFTISGAEFVEALVGIGAARARDMFRQVRQAAPAILFIDEIDAVGRRRGGEGASGGEREQTVNQLLVEMDGFEVSSGVVVIGATNRPDILDPALLRPGRFDRHVTVEPPDLHGRQAILQLHCRGKPLSDEVDFEQLARQTPGFTGADLANVVNEGLLLALREGKGATVSNTHLSEAVLRVLHGPRRRGRLMTAEERKRISFHESGHALVAAAMGRADSVHRVSVVARGRGLGQALMAADGEKVLSTRSELDAELTTAMGGIAAETLFFGEPSTAAEDDIGRATELAREMVGRYGMSAEIGTMRILSTENGYLGSDGPHMDEVSAQTMQEFDQEVKGLLRLGGQRAIQLLTQHRIHLERMAAILESEETLEGPRLTSLLAPARL